MAKQSKAPAIATGKSGGGEARVNDEREGVDVAGLGDGHAEPSRSETYDDEIGEVPIAGGAQDPLAVVVEAAVSPELEILEEIEKEGAKAAAVSAGRVFGIWREFANETAACTKEVLDYSYAFGSELLRATTPAAAAEAQIQFGRSAYLRLLDLLLNLSGTYLNRLRLACDLTQMGEGKSKS
jgi:hypothetical protein